MSFLNKSKDLDSLFSQKNMIQLAKRIAKREGYEISRHPKDRKGFTRKTVSKFWTTTSKNPCAFCQAMNGKEAGCFEVPVSLNDVNSGSELIFDPNYDNGTKPDAHNGCSCKYTYRFVDK